MQNLKKLYQRHQETLGAILLFAIIFIVFFVGVFGSKARRERQINETLTTLSAQGHTVLRYSLIEEYSSHIYPYPIQSIIVETESGVFECVVTGSAPICTPR